MSLQTKSLATTTAMLLATIGAPAVQAEPDSTAATGTPLTANIGLVSSYRFRGLDQTFGRPAVQGGFDYAHPSGFYTGNWNSNVSSGAGYPEGNLEMDFYGGYKATLGDFGVDVGGLYYYYPGSRLDHAFAGVNRRRPAATASGNVDNGEVYIAGNWQFLTLKYAHALTDYFAMPGTRGTGYLDLSASYDLGRGYTLGAHVGRLFMHGFAYTNADGSRYDGRYTDWRIGITKDLAGWIVGAAYVGTTAEGHCGNGEFYCFSSSLASDGSASGSRSRDAGRGIAVLSVTRGF